MKKNCIFVFGLLIIVIIFVLLKFSNLYTVEKAIENGDFITYPEQINIDRYNKFVSNVKNHVDTKLRITEYSKEGIPKVNDLNYSNNIIILHSFYPNNLFDNGEETGEYTDIYFDSIGEDKDMYLINEKLGTKTYICQIRSDK